MLELVPSLLPDTAGAEYAPVSKKKKDVGVGKETVNLKVTSPLCFSLGYPRWSDRFDTENVCSSQRRRVF